MTSDTRRRLLIFGTGAMIGTLLSILLFRWSGYVRENEPRESEQLEVILSSCQLAPGDIFAESCVQKRVIEYQFVPPDAVQSHELGLFVGRAVNVAIEPGSAVRTVDFEPEAEPEVP